MEIKQLRNFITIVEEGNISRAAKRLNMAQPPLSIQIRQLEEELNCTLFERGSRNIVLTDAGTLLFEKAKTIVTITEQIPDELLGLENFSGILHLGIISSVSTLLPTTILPNFAKKYPKFRFDLYERNTYQLIDALFSNVIDLAIVRTPFLNSGLTCYPIRKEHMYAIGHSSYFSSVSSKTIPFQELDNKPLLIYRRWEDILQKYSKASDITPEIFGMSDDARTTLSLANASLGIGIVPASILPTSLPNGIVAKEIVSPTLSSEITLIHIKDKNLSNAAKSFVYFVTNS